MYTIVKMVSMVTEFHGLSVFDENITTDVTGLTTSSILSSSFIANTTMATKRWQRTSIQERSVYDMVEYILQFRVTIAIAIFGILGNILNLIVLSTKTLKSAMQRMEKSAHTGLIALALSDMFVCVAILPHGFVESCPQLVRKENFAFYYCIYSSPIISTFMMISTWLTVTMTISRYFAICYPLKARQLLGMTFAKFSMAVVFLVCIIFNIPKYFVEKSVYKVGFYFRFPGYLRKHPTLQYAYNWVHFSVAILIPLLVLAFCNANLIWALRKSGQLRQQNRTLAKRRRNDTSDITITLIVIVFMFMFLVVPTEIFNFLRDVVISNDQSGLDAFKILAAAGNTLQAINFAFNFILYCSVNTHFRHCLKEVLRWLRSPSFRCRDETIRSQGRTRSFSSQSNLNTRITGMSESTTLV